MLENIKKLKKRINSGKISYGGGETRKSKILLRKLFWEIPLAFNRKLDNNFKDYQKRFNRDGFVIIDELFKSEANYINEVIDNPEIQNGVILKNLNKTKPDLGERNKNRGCPFFYLWSFNDPNLKTIFYNKNLINLLHNHYRRQTFCRNNPYVFELHYMKDKRGNDPESMERDVTELFHIDGQHQTSLMILLNDIDEDASHMEIAGGSHKTLKLNYDRFQLDQKDIAKKYKIEKCIGKKGTVVLFNAGKLYHRLVLKEKKRRAFQMNFTTGYAMWDSEEKIDFPKETNNYIKRFYKKISY
jgi:hypothetical protein